MYALTGSTELAYNLHLAKKSSHAILFQIYTRYHIYAVLYDTLK